MLGTLRYMLVLPFGMPHPRFSGAGSEESFIIRNDATSRKESMADTSIGIDRLDPPPEGVRPPPRP